VLPLPALRGDVKQLVARALQLSGSHRPAAFCRPPRHRRAECRTDAGSGEPGVRFGPDLDNLIGSRLTRRSPGSLASGRPPTPKKLARAVDTGEIGWCAVRELTPPANDAHVDALERPGNGPGEAPARSAAAAATTAMATLPARAARFALRLVASAVVQPLGEPRAAPEAERDAERAPPSSSCRASDAARRLASWRRIETRAKRRFRDLASSILRHGTHCGGPSSSRDALREQSLVTQTRRNDVASE
jgi:hypothetical protein